MPVRIYFRGLILFGIGRNGSLVAELLSEPANRSKVLGAMQGQDDHESGIQIITGQNKNQLLPRAINRGDTVNISIGGRGPRGVRLASNFSQYVPNIATLARLAGLPRLDPRHNAQHAQEVSQHLRATVIVNRGTLRVKEVVTWDASGYSVMGRSVRDLPTTAAQVKFCGVNHYGHAANECVLEVPDTDEVTVTGPTLPKRAKPLKSIRRRNQLAQENTTDIRIHNYEYQRVRPVPWGLDFQWMFARAGYGTVDLGNEARTFARAAIGRDPVYAALLAQDRASLLPGTVGRPFPYIVDSRSLTALMPLVPPTDIDSRPVCVPGFH